MGCSSGKRDDMGIFEPSGVVDAYCLAGSPAIVANLWDVTDKDIDRFTMEMFNPKDGLTSPKDVDIAMLVAKSRDVCKLKRLVGAAPVCYGTPGVLL